MKWDCERIVGVRSRREGFTLLEASIALVVLSVLLGVALTALRSNNPERLRACADMLAADLRLAQSLAMRDATEMTLSLTSTGWKIEHTGQGLSPELPVPLIGGTGSGYEINSEAILGTSVEMRGRLLPSKQSVSHVTFTATGRTKAVESTELWLATGTADFRNCISLSVAPYTGHITAGPVLAGSPPN